MKIANDVRLCLIMALLCAGCIGVSPTSSAPAPTATSGEIWLAPLANPELALDTSGTVGPLRATSSFDRGFGEYDGHFQSSLHVCAATGPVAGPCLAVLGGLVALAGASASLLYELEHGGIGANATRTTSSAFSSNSALPDLSSQLAQRVTALAAHAQAPIRLADTRPTCTAAGTVPPRGISTLDIVDLKVKFEPGYQFTLTLVSRVRTQFCGGDRRAVEQRLAFLGRPVSMSKDPARAPRALEAALAIAIDKLSHDIDEYMRATLLGTY
jgi:hypothetical protein